MAIFSDWYFCHVIQLSPQEMSLYLNLLTVLRSKNSGWAEMEKALENLKSASTLHRAYALPILVDIMFSYRERAWYNPEAESAHSELLLDAAEQIKQCLAYSDSQLEHSCEDSNKLCGLIDDMAGGDFTKLKDELKGINCESGQTGRMQSYLESDKQAMEIVLLSMIRSVGRDDPEALDAIMESQQQFLETSYTGRNGILPKMIALSILGSCKRGFEAILPYLPENWLMYPEYMRLAAETAFAPNLESGAESEDAGPESDAEPEEAETGAEAENTDLEADAETKNVAPEPVASESDMELENLFREGLSLSFFQQYSYKKFQNEASLWFRTERLTDEDDTNGNERDRSEKQMLCAILWQAVLWEYAVELDSRKAMRRLNNLWCVPNYNGNRGYLRELHKQKKITWTAYALAWISEADVLNNRKSGRGNRDHLLMATCTPWQRCREEHVSNHSFARYPGMGTNCGALRAFSAVCVIRALFDTDGGRGNGQGKPINLLRLLLNLGAAFGIPAVQQEWDAFSENHAWSETMRGLGLFANESLMALGTGAVSSSLPKELWEQFVRIARQKAKKGNRQLQMLAGQEGMLICARWAYNAQRSDAAARDKRRRSSWRDYERPLCEYLFPLSEEPAADRIRMDANALWLYERTQWHLCQQMEPFREGNWYEGRSRLENAPQIDVYALLRSAQPSWEQWQGIALDRSAFTGEAWLVALTMRIQSGLAQRKMRREWVEEWRDTLFQSVDTWGSPVLFSMLIAMLRTEADPAEADGGQFDEILHTVVKVVDLSVTEENISCLYHLIDALPTGEALFGTATLAGGCGALLLSLEERSKGSGVWNDLKYYLLQGLAERGRNTKYGMQVLSDYLNRHWDLQCESETRKHYMVHKIQDDWQPLTDHFIQHNGETLQAARQRLNLQHRDLANGFAVGGAVEARRTRRLGIVCGRIHKKGEKREEKNGEIKLSVGFGGKQPEEIVISEQNRSRANSFAVGNLITYHAEAKRAFPPFMDQPNGNDRFKAKLDEITTGGGVKLSGMMPPTADSGRQNETILNYWAPNTLGFRNGSYPVERGIRCQVAYDEQMEAYLPIERDFFRLLMDHFYGRKSEGSVELNYIESPYERGEGSALFSLSPGFNYRLDLLDWDEDSRKALQENLYGKANALGVKVTAQLTARDGFPYLTITGFDNRNQQWAELFEFGEVYIARRNRSTNVYQIERTVESGSIPVKAYLEASGNQAVQNVQLSEDGWSLTRQRQNMVVVTPYKTKYIRLQGDTREQYRQIKEILDLKAGDIIPMQAAFGSRGSTGYGTAYISRFGLKGMCSLESLSMVPELGEKDAFAKNRTCIIERVFDQEPRYRRTAKPFMPEYSVEGDALTGIVTEIADIDGDGIEQSVIKAAFLYGDRVCRLEIPYTAFDVPPQYSGSKVSLTKGEDGWTATATLRDIRVRALWEGKWHKDGVMEGVYLGEVRLPGQPLCHATQDRSRPVIHFWPRRTRVSGAEQLCGITANDIAGRGKRPPVVETSWLHCDPAVFPNARWRSTVYFEYNKRTYWGEAVRGSFKNSSFMWNASAEITQVSGGRDSELYILRRIFRNRSGADYETVLSQSEQMEEINAQWYRKWYDEGDWHLTGKIQKGQFHIGDNRKLPAAVNGDFGKGWLSDVPFCEKELLWYRKIANRYPENCAARVKMVLHNGQWAASCRQAAPYSVDEKLAGVFGAGKDEVIKNNTLYFAGITEDGKLRLEWGYGYTLVVDSENVVDKDGGTIGPTLFFGDRITQFSIQESDGVWKLCVRELKKGTEFKVWRDAVFCSIVHLLKVFVSKEKNSVSISNVSQAASNVGVNGTLSYGWGWQAHYNGRLDRESVQLLLEETEESSEQYIFAQFLIRDGVDAKYQREQVFHYISLKQEDSLLSELQGKRVCLTAGSIFSNYNKKNQRSLGNDYMLRFYLPTERPVSASEAPYEGGAHRRPSIVVTVMRRNFSVDESKMRVSYDQDEADAFFNHQMLVYLMNERSHVGTHEWFGSVLNTPLRSTTSLVRWVQSEPACIVSLGNEVSAEGVLLEEDAYPVVGRIDTTQVEVEVAPGILSKIAKENIEGENHKGSIAQLIIEGEELKARVLLASDQTYVTEVGRAVELLVMDDAAKQFQPDAVNENKRIKHDFTVAGFPQLQLKSYFLERMMHRAWPRVGFVRREGDTLSVYEPNSKNGAAAASIRIDAETGRPSLYFFEMGRTIRSDWSKLSFMDGDCAAIAEMVKKGVWHYHDKCYARIGPDGGWAVEPLPDGSDYREIVVFPDKRDRLRVRPSEFRQYGYSAREIIEYGLPKDRNSFPVAGTDKDNIWIEVFPGRVVELPKSMLFVGRKKKDLSTLKTSLLAPGDELILDSHDFSYEGGQRRLTLIGINYGLRACAAQAGYLLLPVQEAVDGGLRLGGGRWQMTYPCAAEDLKAVGKSVALSQDNGLVLDCQPRRNNTIFVRMKGDCLYTETDRRYEVHIAPNPMNWSGAEWLYKWLDDLRMRKAFFAAVGNVLPMTVTSYVKGNWPIEVCYVQPDEELCQVGDILCCAVLGLVAEGKILYVILRAGRLLLRVPYPQLLPGFPAKHAAAVIRYLQERPNGIWVHKSEDGWRSGIYSTQPTGKTDVYLTDWLEGTHGIVCLRADSMSLVWLPIKQAAFVETEFKSDPNRERQIWNALKKACEREREERKACGEYTESVLDAMYILKEGQYMEDIGAISLIDANPSNRSLRPRVNRRAIPLVEIQNKKMCACIAELYPHGSLIELYSEEDGFDWGKPQPITISQRTPNNAVKAVVEGSMHERIKLSPQLCAYFDKKNRFGSELDDDDEASGQERGIFEEAKGYFAQYEQSISDVEYGRFSNLSGMIGPVEEKLLYLLTYVQEDRENGYWRCFRYICGYLNEWLEKRETQQLLGLGESRIRFPMVDICGVITAALLMNYIVTRGGRAKKPELCINMGKLSVHTVRMLGLACEASIQQEVLAECVEKHTRGGLWERMYILTLGGERSNGTSMRNYLGTLSQPQYNRMISTCRYILQQSMTEDRELLLVAESLLYSVGKLDQYDSFEEHLNHQQVPFLTWTLGKAGRALSPRESDLIEFDVLPASIFYQLRGIWNKICNRKFKSAYLYLDLGTEKLFNETQHGELENLIKNCKKSLMKESRII